MRATRCTATVAVLVTTLAIAATSRAGDGCPAGAIKAAGTYWSCRLGVNAAAAATNGTTLDFRRCDDGFAARWARAAHADPTTCSTDVAGSVKSAVGRCADGVARGIAGGPLPVIAGAALPAAPRAVHDGAGPCEARKLRLAARFADCRARATARTARTGAAFDGSACDRLLASRWSQLESSYGAGCPSTGERAAIAAVVAMATDDIGHAFGDGALPRCGTTADWPQLNRDPQNSRTAEAETRIAPASVARLVPRWRLDGLSAVTGTPAVVDGVVYFGDWAGVLRAHRASDGVELWHRPFASAIRAAPLVTGDRVVIAESGGRLHAVRRDTGEPIWSTPIDTQPLLSIDSSPVLAGNTIVIGVASFEQGVRKPDYSFRGNVVGFDATTGAERWRVYMTPNSSAGGAGVSVWSSAAVDYARKLVFVGTGQTYEQPASPRGDAIVAIRYDTGEVAWVHQFTAGDVFTVAGGGPGPDADIGASPNLFAIDGRDVVGVGQKNGVYHVLDRTTGDLVWETPLTPGSPLGGVMVTAAVGDGTVFVNSDHWRVFSIFSGTLSPLDTSTTFALDARTGAIRWQREMPAPMFGAMTYANGVVFQGTIDGTVHALSAQDGTELWHDAPGGGIAGGFSVVDGALYVGRGFWFAAPPATPNGGFVAYEVPPDHWVGTWSTSPLCFGPATLLGLPAGTRFENQTVRMVVRNSIGGDTVRVRLTNGCGTTPLLIGAATVGRRTAGAAILAGTQRTLTFGGLPFVSIPPGTTATSDPIALALPDSSDLAISLHLPNSTVPTTSHPQAATGWVSGPGNVTQDTSGAPFTQTVRQWFFLDAVEVLVQSDAAAVVAFGDSIIDGAGSTYDADTRWPDFLARRFLAAGKRIGVLNQGINGNKVLTSLLGESALVRFDRDVLGQAGVKYVIFLEGVNDIGLAPIATAEQVIDGYRQLVDRAHAAGLKIYGGTLPPAKDTPIPFYSAYDETRRAAINQFIREGTAFDAVFDFDAAVRDPNDPVHWAPGFSPDGIHPSDAGAAAMADAIDLSLFP